MILVRGCYNNKLSGCQGTVAVRHCFAQQNYLMLKRSRTGAYAPPHFYAVNHRQMILVRGCYNIKFSGCQATVAVRHRFAFGKTKTAPTKADAVSVTMILSDLSDNLDFGKHTLGQCLYRNARTGRL